MNWLSKAIGIVLVLLALLDIYFTVLYPRSGTSIISMPLSKGLWQLFRLVAQVPGTRRGSLRVSRWANRFLSHCGSIAVIMIAATWLLLLIIGFALIIWTALGSEIQASQGETPTDFATALYYSGYSLTTLGVGDLVPRTSFYKLLTIAEAAFGFSTFTLALTYFLSVYNALIRRNTFALSLHHRTKGEANTAEMLARLGTMGKFSGARQEIAGIARDLLNLLVSHHSYPVLHYFRFPEAYYSLARITLISMDTVTLIKSTLDTTQYAALIHSTAVAELEQGGLYLLHQLAESFLPKQPLNHTTRLEQEWRDLYYRAVERLKIAGIATNPDLESGADTYVALRRQWEGYVIGFASYMAYDWSEIAPAERQFS